MASYEGDVILAPGYSKTTVSAPVEILYSMSALFQKGGTLTPGQGDMPAGTAVKYDAATKRYMKSTAAADTVGFLRLGVNAGDASSFPKQGVFVLGGEVKAALCTVNGVALTPITAAAQATALGGKYLADRDVIRF